MDKPTPDQDKVEYEVGYGKPPKSTQFKAGQSGNRKGRPKGAQNFQTVMEKELNSTVTVTEGGRRKQIRKRDVVIKQVVNKAAAGDLKAASLLIAEARNTDALKGAGTLPTAPTAFSEADQLTLQSIVARIRASAPDNGNTSPVTTSIAASDLSAPVPAAEAQVSATPELQPGVTS
jgi:Family of unknown function (DUF5681)